MVKLVNQPRKWDKHNGLTVVFVFPQILHHSQSISDLSSTQWMEPLTFAFPLERQEADAVGELQIAEVPSLRVSEVQYKKSICRVNQGFGPLRSF